MSEIRPLNPWKAANQMTMWFTETMWLPFVEGENCNITGPGHQNKEAFARMINDYDREAAGDLDWDEQEHITHNDVSHAYGKVHEDEYGEFWFTPTSPTDPGAVPITTVWGVR